MNKKLLAVAIGAALTAPMYAAHAAVTIGGQAHVSADYTDTFDATANNATTLSTNSRKMWNVSSNVSNIFFKAEEDLGGGLKGVFFLQEYFRLDNNSGTSNTSVTLTNRMFDAPAYAGLVSNSLGSLLLGNMDGPAKLTGRYVDLFNNQIGDSRNTAADNTRFQNAIAYVTPTFFGVSVTLAHSTNLNNQIAATSADTTINVGSPPVTPAAASVAGSTTGDALGVKYEQGPLMVGFGYHHAINHDSTAATYADNKVADLSAGFKIAGARIVGFYESNKANGFVNGTDADTYGIGASYTFGNETVKAQYYNLTKKATGVADISSNIVALGYDHAFSKTFTGYVAVAKSSNDIGGTVGMAGGGGHGDAPNVAAGQDQSGLSLGVIYNF